tara:strand:- start:2074 stop:2463 length:390 start_codon:yes stop_codon:yes gene_type:complete
MKRIVENVESLDAIRSKVESRETDFDNKELVHLNLCWIELQKSYGKQIVKPLDQSCSSCRVTAMRVIHNYITNEEPQEVVVVEVEPIEEPQDEEFVIDYFETLNLYQLRELYPHIKAKTVSKFIERLNK